jgi:hypothetical protein
VVVVVAVVYLRQMEVGVEVVLHQVEGLKAGQRLLKVQSREHQV